MAQAHELWLFHANNPRSVLVSVDDGVTNFEDIELVVKNQLKDFGANKPANMVFWELKVPLEADQLLPSGVPLEAIATRIETGASADRFVMPQPELGSGLVRVVVESVRMSG
ncbi:hypothetical protein BJ138DRAFT_1127956 [Hygrophoropsis aurantiaca]|uniref:Uncharacterized protein n=1 Tax=Hygrophoropsis aurantiaca TaxID=72124 RepID=A0ACB8A7I0_9AGAM|nr:hypothetical protein BJ138DRAFT_1127956 [Hygrophoropsis aurantiaca]